MRVLIDLECLHETHDRETFQREGHFVPGNCTGPTVHALTLKTPQGLQVLRTLGPTQESAMALMRTALEEYVYTTARAYAQREYTYERYQELVKERGDL